MRAGAGEVLYASFAGPLPAGADVENALFYNLDQAGVFSGLMADGVAFERNPTPPERGVRYVYETVAAEADFRHWGCQRDLAALETHLSAERLTLAGIWWSMRSQPESVRPLGPPRGSDEPFTMTLDVEGPVPGLSPGLLKTILDGTICALQSQDDRVVAQDLGPLIASALGVAPDAVVDALLDRSGSALGVRSRLVHRHGKGVKWSPDDDRCVAARILFAPSKQWRISGSASVATPEDVAA